ncbi:MAG: glycoside hydrolase family 1 protein [Natronosporangium sp.]
MGRYRDPRAANRPPAGTDPKMDATAAELRQLMPYGWRWEVFRDGLGLIVCAAWHEAPEWVCLDPRSPGDLAAARLVDGLQNRVFLDPLSGHGYPADVLAVARRFGPTDWLRNGDEATIAAPLDLLGVNYYTPAVVAARPGEPATAAYPGSEDIAFVPAPGPVTEMGWTIEPAGLTGLLERIARDCPGVPLLVTENGAAFDDRPDSGGQVPDPRRIAYLDGHLRAVHAAIARGVDVRGYLVWTLLDNFEWAEGYRQRFGLVYVDYPSQSRVPKDSAWWYRDVIARGGLAAAPTTDE